MSEQFIAAVARFGVATAAPSPRVDGLTVEGYDWQPVR